MYTVECNINTAVPHTDSGSASADAGSTDSEGRLSETDEIELRG